MLDDENPMAKLRNRPIHTYMCMECSERIAERTMERHASGNFRLYRDKKSKTIGINKSFINMIKDLFIFSGSRFI